MLIASKAIITQTRLIRRIISVGLTRSSATWIGSKSGSPKQSPRLRRLVFGLKRSKRRP